MWTILTGSSSNNDMHTWVNMTMTVLYYQIKFRYCFCKFPIAGSLICDKSWKLCMMLTSFKPQASTFRPTHSLRQCAFLLLITISLPEILISRWCWGKLWPVQMQWFRWQQLWHINSITKRMCVCTHICVCMYVHIYKQYNMHIKYMSVLWLFFFSLLL